MNVLILGVGDAFTARHFGSSALIQAPEGLVLIDCPDLIHRVLRFGAAMSGWEVDAFAINDIILTHLHGDHCNGLESFAFARYIKRQNDPDDSIKPRLHCSQPVADRLWERLAPSMDRSVGDPEQPRTIDDFFELHIVTPGETAQIAGLSVKCRFTKHPIPTTGLLFAEGRITFAWSSDTPFDEEHIAWLADADLIVHESNLGDAHTPIEDLNALPTKMRKKMRLIHLPDDYHPRASDIRPLEEGEVLTIG